MKRPVNYLPVISESGAGERGIEGHHYRLMPIGDQEYALFEVDENAANLAGLL